MHFEHNEKTTTLATQLNAFMQEHVYPLEKDYHSLFSQPQHQWKTPLELDR